MYKQILHTPEGVRDIYNEECSRKNALSAKLDRILKLYGYKNIQTPTFEFFDVFSREIGTVPSRELYKFFDREGNTLVLRPDVTPSIARAVAKYFTEEDMPVRLCYMANTFINSSELQGRLKETTQLGAELIGDGSAETDAELLALVVESLLKAGLKEFQVSVGHVDFFQSLLKEAGLPEEMELELREFISNKNIFGVKELLDPLELPDPLKEALASIPNLFGSVDVLDRAESCAVSVDAKAALARLRKIYRLMEYYGYEKYISFDLGMLGSYGYYTGILFRAYTFGTGDAVVKGGRYDQLMGYFGKPAASIGFVVQADELLNALSRQKIAVPVEEGPTLVLYDSFVRDQAIEASIQIRRDGGKAALMRRIESYPLSFYSAYAKRNALEKVVYFAADGNVQTVKPQEEKA